MVDGITAERAILINLDRWVSEGVEPPPSAYPRLSEGTAVSRESVLEQFRSFPGVGLLDQSLLPRLRRLDLGPDTGRGIGRLPAVLGEPYPSYAAAVDADGNERVDIRAGRLSARRHPYRMGPASLIDWW